MNKGYSEVFYNYKNMLTINWFPFGSKSIEIPIAPSFSENETNKILNKLNIIFWAEKQLCSLQMQ